jgi:HEAT repeat protein
VAEPARAWTGTAPAETPPPPPAKAPRSPLLIVGLVAGGVVVALGLLAVLGATAFLLLRAKGGKSGDLEPTAQAVEDLKAGDGDSRIAAANALAETPVDHARRAEVARALEPLLTDDDPQVRLAGVRALAVWGTKENVPALVNVLKDDNPSNAEARRLAMETLGKLHDDRAAGVLAQRLANNFDRPHASRALQDIGPAAEKAVVQYYFHPDAGTQQEARQLLRSYGTRDDVIVDQAIEDLQAREPGRRQAVAEWLTQANPDQNPRRAEVARALEAFLDEQNWLARSAGLKALARWATRDNLPNLVRALKRDDLAFNQTRHQVMEILGKIKDRRGAEAVAGRLPNHFDRGPAVQALREMGPIAQKEVAPYLFHKDLWVRNEARTLLREYGTKDDIILPEAAAALKAPEDDVRREAATWLGGADAEELRKPENARRLAPDLIPLVLKDDRGFHAKEVRRAAIQALGKVRDEKGALAVATRLYLFPSHRDLEEAKVAAEALAQMGPVAEDAVLECLQKSPDGDVRITCCNVLREVGTKKSLQVLGTISRIAKRPERPAALQALQAIQAREKSAPAPKAKD